MLVIFLVLISSIDAAIYDAASHPKFFVEAPIPPVINVKRGDALSISIHESTHDFGLIDKDTNGSVSTNIIGYNGVHPGPTFDMERNLDFTVEYVNKLPDQHLLRAFIDPTIHCGEVVDTTTNTTFDGDCMNPETRIVTHLHGAETGPVADGYAESWWDNKNGNGFVGPYYQTNTFHYNIYQEAAHLWYHDHALGITRINIYSGLVGHWFVRDDNEKKLNLPSGQYEIPLVVFDRDFDENGQLDYTVDHFSGVDGVPDGTPSIQPEFFGTYMTVNGVVWPKITVEARKYRFRLLNGCDSRFLHIFSSEKIQAWIIGADQGLLHTPVKHDFAKDGLLIAPSERYDLIIDFRKNAGQKIIFSNTANVPFPGGDPVDPNGDGLLLAFEVGSKVHIDSDLPEVLAPPFVVPGVDNIRTVTLNEIEDEFGRVNPMLGIWENGVSVIKGWSDAITEIIASGSTEIWRIINFTEDAHPVHIHLVGFQVLGRQIWNPITQSAEGDMYSADKIGIFYKQVERQAKKDTVIVYPGTVLTIRAQFNVDGLTMWHCHITSHEDHEMMRPILIVANGTTPEAELNSFRWNAPVFRNE